MSTPAASCAWCEAEQGYHTGGSHGICERHRDALMSQVNDDRAALLPNDDRDAILACGQRYDRIAFSASVLVGCIAAGAVLLAGVWFVQWMGWWPR